MKTFFSTIAFLFVMFIFHSVIGQNDSQYTLESLVDMLGRSSSSPKLDLLNAIPEKGCEACLYTGTSNGRIEFPNGAIYEGNFSGLVGNEGTYTFKSNERFLSYSGAFVNGEASGKARLNLTDGETIHGVWENGVIRQVEFMERDGFTYTGDVTPDLLMDGVGVVMSIGGDFRCDGNFINDQIYNEKDYIICTTTNGIYSNAKALKPSICFASNKLKTHDNN